MTNSAETWKVKITDRIYNIKCPEAELETLKAAASFLEESIEATQRESLLSFSDASVVTALNLCGQHIVQYNKLPQKTYTSGNSFSDEYMQKITELNSKIEEALEEV
jgi:cell division protein ZapA (FtsZ GTPase activity inhibitor)